MVKSMTGFGKITIENGNRKVVIEIKSLNSKTLDLNLKMPNLYKEKEMEIRNIVKEQLDRGKVEMCIYFDNTESDKDVTINKPVVTQYFNQLLDIANELGIEADKNKILQTVMRFPDTLQIKSEELEDTEWEALEAGIKKALEEINKFRIQEGLTRAFRDFLYSQEFTEIHTPKIGAKGAEGGANIFKLEYFHRPAVLAQSPQFYKQMMVGVFDRVFETAPVFRAEKHNTKRHLNEYTSLDFEMGYIDGFEDIMAMETGFLQYAMELLKKDYARELKVLGVELPDVSQIPAVKFADIKEIVAERKANGEFKNLKDFIERMSGKDINKRTIENFIKSGAFDELGGTRKQFMVIYVQILDQVNREKKNSMTGQMSLFDIVGEEQKSEFDIPLPNVGEYEKSTKLAFEKEVLGIYLSGHPMEEYEEQWRKGISKTTQDFQFDEELGFSRVSDGAAEIIGGIIASKTIKYTKNNKTMCFLTIEDIMGSVEVVVFPRDYERYHQYLEVENVVFVKGRVSEEDEASSKLICEKVIPFGQKKQELWIQYPDKETFLQGDAI